MPELPLALYPGRSFHLSAIWSLVVLVVVVVEAAWIIARRRRSKRG